MDNVGRTTIWMESILDYFFDKYLKTLKLKIYRQWVMLLQYLTKELLQFRLKKGRSYWAAKGVLTFVDIL
jgi:hypothetical protein